MLKFLHLTVFITGALITQTIECLPLNSSSTLDERIIGGADAVVGQFPHQVSLRKNNGTDHFCGGSIIGKRFILTAAHCMEEKYLANVKVAVGANLISTGGTLYALEKVIIHPKYGTITSANDIAVLRTVDVIVFTKLIQPIALPTKDRSIEDGLPLLISGWGKIGKGRSPDVLQWMRTAKLNHTECRDRLKYKTAIVYPNTVCTTNPVGMGVCFHDSGSPLTTQDTPRVLVGVVSWGVSCAQGYPDVYAGVSSHLAFIRSVMQE